MASLQKAGIDVQGGIRAGTTPGAAEQIAEIHSLPLAQIVSYMNRESINHFAELLFRISLLSPEMRIRYSTSHPKDCSDELLHVHRERPTVCNFIHLPVQHGSTEVLRRMRRTYTRPEYLALVERARTIVPDVSLSTDIIAGFCAETEDEHAETLSLMRAVRYDHAFTFAYSERPATYAERGPDEADTTTASGSSGAIATLRK